MQTSTDLSQTSGRSAAAYRELAADLLRHGQPQMALNYCHLALQTRPTAQTYKLLGDTLQRLNRASEAEAAYQKALALHPNWPELQANLGTLYAQQQQWLKAILCYQKALWLKPNAGEIQRNLEQVWTTIGQQSNLSDLYDAFLLAPEQVGAQNLLRLGQLLQARGQTEPAHRCQQQARGLADQRDQQQDRLTPQPAIGLSAPVSPAVSPPSSTAPSSADSSHQAAVQAYSLGNVHVQQQQWSQAEAAYRRALELAPDFAIAQWHLAQVLDRLNQREQAISHYFAALTRQPDLAKPAELCKFGQMFQQQNQPEPALRCYQWAIQQDESCLEAHRQAAELLSRQHQPELALVHYEQALRLQPDAPTYHALGDAYLKLSQGEPAAAAYRQAIQLDPSFSWSHNNLGDALMQIEQWDEAAEAYQQAIALNPSFCWSHYNLGEAWSKLAEWDKAIAAYQSILQLQPNLAEATEKLHQALHHRAKRDLDLALNYYQQMIERDPTNLALLHQAIELQPNRADLYLSLAQALSRQGQSDQAAVFYNIALQLQPELGKTAPTLRQYLAHRRQSQPLHQDFSELLDLQQAAEVITQSQLFDADYYSTQSPESLQGWDPLQHYLQIGAKQGHKPHPYFDGAFYLKQYPDVAQAGVNPLAHYLKWGAAEGRDPHPLFETGFYLEQHSDIATSDMNPLVHYALYGLAEGRQALSAERVAAVIQALDHDPKASYLRCLQEVAGLHRICAKVGVYCSSQGNYFMAEIADFVAAAFEQLGFTVQRLCETDQRPADLDFDLIVAPHEFFYLGAGENWQNCTWLSRSTMLNVEQPHTSWFAKALPFLRQARIVLDINSASATILEHLGLPAYFLSLGYLPDYAPFNQSELPNLFALKGLAGSVRQAVSDPDAPLTSRPLDLHFIGTLSPRREQFFANSAVWLSRFHCFFHIPPLEGPLLKGKDQALDTQAVIGLSQRSKILLNIHREELPYFEWHRMIFHGLWQKTLVVTEPCHPVPGLIAGEHFIECRFNEMAGMVEWLLNTPSGQAEAERIRQAGYRVLTEKLTMRQLLPNLISLLTGISEGGESCSS